MWSQTIKFVVIAMLGTGCASEVVKDGEYAIPTDGKADSFRSPTEHGTLPFGSQSRARISDSAEFHAWTFSLSGDADVDLRLDASDTNLDTVAYLYRRDDSSERWGRYIRKNDDDGQRLQSRIEGSFDEGEYRIIVKGFKAIHRGSFYITPTCQGAGCSRGDGGFEVPSETGFTATCATRIFEASYGENQGGTSLTVPARAESGFDKEVMIALSHYRDLSDYLEYFEEDEPGDVPTFEVDVYRLSSGTVVTMHDGGDESSTDYTFDTEGELLSYYVHNQSPWTGYFCGLEGEEAIDEPGREDCLGEWTQLAPHGETTSGGGIYVVGESNDEIGETEMVAIDYFISSREWAGEDLDFRFEAWGEANDDGGMEVHFDDAGVVIYVVRTFGAFDHWVMFDSDENTDEGMKMICEEVE